MAVSSRLRVNARVEHESFERDGVLSSASMNRSGSRQELSVQRRGVGCSGGGVTLHDEKLDGQIGEAGIECFN
jgi:hypothetical protein